MYFKFSMRVNPDTGLLSGYYRLVESYRNEEERVCHRTILNVGFMEDTDVHQRNKIQRHLTDKYERKQSLFAETDPVVIHYVSVLWQRIIESRQIDVSNITRQQRMVDVDTLQHSDAREIGAEWIGLHAWTQLNLSSFLSSKGWSQEQIQLAATQIISRAVYPASEYTTAKWIKENSGICELTGYDAEKITKDKLYQGALSLYAIKDDLERYLSHRTNDLFTLQDKILLYDLTNTYYEGAVRNSNLAKFGRSKEKRNDARLIVLALVVNTEGFIKYSTLHEGNIADCDTLEQMMDKLTVYTCPKKAIVVLDAGIATEDNLQYISGKGYYYLCVTRARLKEYTVIQDRLMVLLETKSKHIVTLKSIQTDKNTDYYLEVKSEAKKSTENGMKTQFEERFEMELQKIYQSIHKKGGIKKASKVHERIGRAKEKYPSVQRYYNIEVSTDDSTQNATNLTWSKDAVKYAQKTDEMGIYFLRTNLNMQDEVIIWNVYNTIREIENTFRTLKTDLALRPIYHKTDKAAMAHLHLGLLAYWLVNTLRHQLKKGKINHCWSEIVRIANTQKIVTTSGQNVYDKVVTVRKCTQPIEKLKHIYRVLIIHPRPIKKQKSVVHKLIAQKNQTLYLQGFSP
jgi:transposase